MHFLKTAFPPATNPQMVALLAAVAIAAYAIARWVTRRRSAGLTAFEQDEIGYPAQPEDASAARRERRLKCAAFALAVVFAAVYAALSVQRYYKFLCGSWDLGIFTTLLDSALHGAFFRDYRGSFDHFSPLAGVYLPLYALWRDPRMLLVAQAAVVALAALPLYLAAREASGRKDVAAALAIAYLLCPLLSAAVLFDFHALSLSPIVFFSMVYFCLRERWKSYFVCIILLVCVKESEAILVLGTGLYLLSRRRYAIGVVTCVLAVVAGYVEIYYALPALSGEAYRHMGRFEGLSGRWSLETAQSAYFVYQRTLRSVVITLFILVPMGFLAARRWRPLVFVLGPAFLSHVVSTNDFMNVVFGHYAFTVVAAAFGAAALASEGIGAADLGARRATAFVIASAVLSNVLFSYPADEHWYAPQARFDFSKSLNVMSAPLPVTAARRDFYRILPPESFFITASRLFPAGSTVAAQNSLGYMLASRCRIRGPRPRGQGRLLPLSPGRAHLLHARRHLRGAPEAARLRPLRQALPRRARAGRRAAGVPLLRDRRQVDGLLPQRPRGARARPLQQGPRLHRRSHRPHDLRRGGQRRRRWRRAAVEARVARTIVRPRRRSGVFAVHWSLGRATIRNS